MGQETNVICSRCVEWIGFARVIDTDGDVPILDGLTTGFSWE